MALILTYKHMTDEGEVFHEREFTGKVGKVEFRVFHYGSIDDLGDSKLYVENVQVGDFTDTVLKDAGMGRYDVELRNGYLLYHLIPEE